jgi:anti-anti-sigma factor
MPANSPRPTAIAVERHAPGVVLVTLRGEHDLNTRLELGEALARAGEESSVLVDLSECDFIDSTVIGALVVGFQTVSERGRRFELTIPADAKAVQRVVQVAGLATFLTIHETLEAGLASISAS